MQRNRAALRPVVGVLPDMLGKALLLPWSWDWQLFFFFNETAYSHLFGQKKFKLFSLRTSLEGKTDSINKSTSVNH